MKIAFDAHPGSNISHFKNAATHSLAFGHGLAVDALAALGGRHDRRSAQLRAIFRAMAESGKDYFMMPCVMATIILKSHFIRPVIRHAKN